MNSHSIFLSLFAFCIHWIPAASTLRSTRNLSATGVAIANVTVNIFFDSFPSETGWELIRIANAEVIESVPTGTYDYRNKSVSETYSLIVGEEYRFTIEDGFGDGICCVDPGYYEIMQGDIELASGGDNFGIMESKTFTVIEQVTDAPVFPPTLPPITPTTSPSAATTTQAPSQVPSLSPQNFSSPSPSLSASPSLSPSPSLPPSMSAAPSVEPSDVEDYVNSTVQVSVNLEFDGYPSEIGWTISTTNGMAIVASKAIGSYPELTERATENVTLLGNTRYIFTIEDSFGDGLSIPDNGTYTVKQGDVDLLSGGGNFGFGATANFTTLDAPNSTQAPTPFACRICGEGNVVTLPENFISIPGQINGTCTELQEAGDDGLLPEDVCAALLPLVDIGCGCQPQNASSSPEPSVSVSPTQAPVFFICNVCGDGEVANPDWVFSLPGEGNNTCLEFQDAGKVGIIGASDCEYVSVRVEEECGCLPPISSFPPTTSPTYTPS